MAHLVFSETQKKQIYGVKSNKETPKEIQERALTMLRASLDYSLEFRYCFWTVISAFSQKVSSESDRLSESGGPSLPF